MKQEKVVKINKKQQEIESLKTQIRTEKQQKERYQSFYDDIKRENDNLNEYYAKYYAKYKNLLFEYQVAFVVFSLICYCCFIHDILSGCGTFWTILYTVILTILFCKNVQIGNKC